MTKTFSLIPIWPSDLPAECPHCGSEFDPRVNLTIGRFGIAETLETMAWWAPLPSFPLALAICLLNPDRGFIMAVALGTILPAVILKLIRLLVPKKRRVRCVKCDYEAYFPKDEVSA